MTPPRRVFVNAVDKGVSERFGVKAVDKGLTVLLGVPLGFARGKKAADKGVSAWGERRQLRGGEKKRRNGYKDRGLGVWRREGQGRFLRDNTRNCVAGLDVCQ
jgi:hypothetical protein